MTDELVKRLDDLDPILETEFDTQLSVQRNPYGATKAIEDALYLLRDQAARLEALTAERDEYRRLATITELVACECKIQEARAEKAEADNARLASELTKAAARLEWCAGIIHSDKGRDQGFAWAEEARAALTGKADT